MLTIRAMSSIIPIARLRNGGIAQLARACGSYPQCPRFESRCRYQKRRRYFYLRLNFGPLVKRLRHRPFTAVTWVRFPYGSPRRRKLYIACDDFLCFASKVISRSLRCPKGLALRRSSFPNQTRLRLGFDSVFLCPQNWPGVPKQISPPKVG